jgi:dihydropteroate synthase
MGIINITPDSFYAGSRQTHIDGISRQAELMINEGADILDIGAQSTRPGSDAVTAEEELKRVIPAVAHIHRLFPHIVLSIDTYYSRVAAEAVSAGAAMVNDIGGGNLDNEMFSVVASLNVPYILMHIKGNPQTMQLEAQYENVTREVLDYFIRRVSEARQAGIRDVIMDPGFGFAKASAHNFELLKKLSLLKIAGCPILLGLSRKATIYKTLGITVEEALNGTTVLHTIGLMNGADILRVHDVKEAKEAIKLVMACMNTDTIP